MSSFLLILFSEIGDKTFFIAVLLALQQSRSAVFVGTFGALAVMTVVSVCGVCGDVCGAYLLYHACTHPNIVHPHALSLDTCFLYTHTCSFYTHIHTPCIHTHIHALPIPPPQKNSLPLKNSLSLEKTHSDSRKPLPPSLRWDWVRYSTSLMSSSQQYQVASHWMMPLQLPCCCFSA